MSILDCPLPPPPLPPDPTDTFGWRLAKDIMSKDFYSISRSMYERYFMGRPDGKKKWLVFFETYDWSVLLKDKQKRYVRK